MQPRTPFSAAAAALLVLASPALLAARAPSGHRGERTADVPTTTVVEDDFLTLFPSGDGMQDDFVAGDDEDPSVDLPGTGTHTVTWGSVALAVAATGAIITANSRSRRPRRPRSDARSGPAA